MALIFWAALPLKFTVLGVEDVTSKVPELIFKVDAIPRFEPDDNCKEMPFIITLKRLAIPLSVEEPVKVPVPAVADKLPLTVIPEAMEKSVAVVMEPVTNKLLKLLVPFPEIVFAAPLTDIAPALAVKLPLTTKLPVIKNELAVETEPVTVKLSGDIPEPEIVVPGPDIISVPPDTCVNEPPLVVARLPDIFIVPANKVIRGAAIVK